MRARIVATQRRILHPSFVAFDLEELCQFDYFRVREPWCLIPLAHRHRSGCPILSRILRKGGRDTAGSIVSHPCQERKDGVGQFLYCSSKG